MTGRRSTRAFLHAHGLGVQPEDFERLVQEAVERLPRGLYRENPRRELTVPEAEVLAEGGFELDVRELDGGELDGRELDEEDPLLRTAAEYAALVKSGLTTQDAAQRLGVAQSRIRQRLTSQPPTLYGIRLESGWRIPEFQFENDELLPGMAEVVAALDSELHPLSVYRWFVSPTSDLNLENHHLEGHRRQDHHLDDRSVSPRDWLRLGLPPAQVVTLARGLP